MQSSAYAQGHNTTCPGVTDQIDQTVQMLADNGITFQGSKITPNSSVGPIVSLSRLWIDIEDEVPSKYYDVDPLVNQELIAALVNRMVELQIPIGIYATKTYWTNIMGDVLGYGQYPLWYPRYDAVNNMDFFVPFADFTSVQIKQTGGDTSLCGISQVDSDYTEY